MAISLFPASVSPTPTQLANEFQWYSDMGVDKNNGVRNVSSVEKLYLYIFVFLIVYSLYLAFVCEIRRNSCPRGSVPWVLKPQECINYRDHIPPRPLNLVLALDAYFAALFQTRIILF